MGKKEIGVKRVVLDTNVLVSALLFTGKLSSIVDLWKAGKIIPVLSRETLKELTEVLAYPKFSLIKKEIKNLIVEEIVPYFELISTDKAVKNICRDTDDDKFLSCALSASVDFIVSGDKDLSGLKQFQGIKIITPQELLKFFRK